MLTKLILLIIAINLIGSLLKKMQNKKRAREKMAEWDQEETTALGGMHPGPSPAEEEPPPPIMAEPQDVLASFFDRLRDDAERPAEPEPAPVPQPSERPMVHGPFTQGAMMDKAAFLDDKKDYDKRSIFEGKSTPILETRHIMDKESILARESLLDSKHTLIQDGEEGGNPYVPVVTPGH